MKKDKSYGEIFRNTERKELKSGRNRNTIVYNFVVVSFCFCFFFSFFFLIKIVVPFLNWYVNYFTDTDTDDLSADSQNHEEEIVEFFIKEEVILVD